ncbi:MAG: hypothetical protein CMJ94_13915 [Planctomycetes bacterium]|nr:hypothetical protein [Planctomycetota bacterium]
MRVGNAPASGSGGNWIILVAMVAALGAIVGAILELNRDGAKYAQAFVAQDALRLLIESELAADLDPLLHQFAVENELEIERVYRAGGAFLQTLEAGEVEGRHLDAAFARNLPPTAARPAVQRWRIEGDAERELCFSSWVTSGRQQSLARIESWLKEQLRVPVGPGSGG